MSSYNPPVAYLPIFNSQEYLIESGLVTFNGGISTNTIYNGTGTFSVPSSGSGTLALTNNVVDLTSHQTIAGQKSFSNIANYSTTNLIPGGQAFQVNSLTNPYTTRLYSVNSSYSTDWYYSQFNGIYTLVSTASTAALTNKTIPAFQSGSPPSTSIYFTPPGSISYPCYAVYAKTYVGFTMIPLSIFAFSNGTTYINQVFQLTVSGGNLSYGG